MYNCTVRENCITTLGLSLSGTIAIKQCACNCFLQTIESAMWQRKKIRQVLGLSQLFNNVLDNAHTTRPWATPYRWGSGSGIWLWDSVSRGPIPNSKTAQYQTQRHWVLLILFIFCVKLHYSRCSIPNIIPNRPAKKKRTHNSLNTKITFFMAFFSYVKTYHNGLGRPPRHGFIKATFSIAEIGFSIVITIV